MESDLYFDGKKYISSKRAGDITGYTNDYIGQLCRSGKVEGRLIGKTRFIKEDSILNYKKRASILKNNSVKNSNNLGIPKSKIGDWDDMILEHKKLPIENKDISSVRTKNESMTNGDIEKNIKLNISTEIKDKQPSTINDEVKILLDEKPGFLSSWQKTDQVNKVSKVNKIVKSKNIPSPYISKLPIIFNKEIGRKVAMFLVIFSLVSGTYFYSNTKSAEGAYKKIAQTFTETVRNSRYVAFSTFDFAKQAVVKNTASSKYAINTIYKKSVDELSNISLYKIPNVEVSGPIVMSLMTVKNKTGFYLTSAADNIYIGYKKSTGSYVNNLNRFSNKVAMAEMQYIGAVKDTSLILVSIPKNIVRNLNTVYKIAFNKTKILSSNLYGSTNSIKLFDKSNSSNNIASVFSKFTNSVLENLNGTTGKVALNVYYAISGTGTTISNSTKVAVSGTGGIIMSLFKSKNDTHIVVNTKQTNTPKNNSSKKTVFKSNKKQNTPANTASTKKDIKNRNQFSVNTRSQNKSTQPIIISYSGITGKQLEDKLNQLNNKLRSEIYKVRGNSNTSNSVQTVYRTVALSNVINNLTGVTISNATVSGISGLTNADIPDDITASNYLPLTGGTITGALTGTGLTLSGQIVVSGTATSTIAGDTNFDSGTLYIDSVNNRVGVGTTSPSDTFAVNGSLYLASISAPSVTTGRLYNASNNLYWSGNLIGGTNTANWTLSGSNAYRATGNIGIGTTSPYAKLSVVGEVVAEYFTSTSTSQASTFPYASTTALTVSGNTYLGSLTGALQAINGLVSATSSISSSYIEDAYLKNNADDTTTGQLTATNFVASGAAATSTFAGGLAVETSGLVYDYSSGNVGIGTAAPSNSLQVNSGRIVVGSTDIGNVTNGVSIYGTIDNTAYGYQAGQTASNNITFGWVAKTTASNGYGYVETYAGNNDLLLQRDSIGNVGIGIANGSYPQSKLSVNGGVAVGSYSTANTAPTNGLIVSGSVGIGTASPSKLLHLQNASAISRPSQMLIETTASGGAGIQFKNIDFSANLFQLFLADDGTGLKIGRDSKGDYVTFKDGGNVGIGTTSPYAKLSVVGEAVAEYFTATSTTATSTFTNLTYSGNLGTSLTSGSIPFSNGTILTQDNSNLYWDDTNNRLGIGTASPVNALTIVGGVNIDFGNKNTGSLTAGTSLRFGASGSGEGIASKRNSGGNLYGLDFYTSSSNRLSITGSGDIGIGTASPRSVLTIYGDTTNRGTLSIENSDTDVNTGEAIGIINFRSNESSVSSPIPTDDIVAQIQAVAAAQHTGGVWPTDIVFSNLNSSSNTLTERMRINSSGNIGIGSTTPWAKLSITNTSSSKPSFIVEDGTSPDASPFIIDDTGNVGIGSSTPNSKLVIDGNFADITALTIDGFNNDAQTYAMRILDENTSNDVFFLRSQGTGPDAPVDMYVSGDIGIGTNAPAYPLEVVGGASNDLIYGQLIRNNDTTSSGSYAALGFSVNNTAMAKAGILFERDKSYGRGNLHFALNNDTDNTSPATTTDIKMSILTSGNVGIGNTSPSEKLNVQGTIAGQIFTATSTTATSTFAGGLNVGSGGLVYDYSSGNVGIGTAAPSTKLQIDSGGVSGGLAIGGDYPSWNGANGLYMTGQFFTSGEFVVGNGSTLNFGDSRTGIQGYSTTGNYKLIFKIDNTERMRIDSSGNIGIGTTSPLAKLDVYGDTILSGQNRYINFDYTTGTGGYGFRDNAGTLQYKNLAGAWAGIGSGSGGGAFTSAGGLTYLSTATDIVGIGTSTPYSALTVWGNGTVTGKAFEVVNNASTTLLSVSDNGLTTLTNATTSQLTVTGPAYFNSTTRLNNVTYSWPGADGSNAQVLASDGAGGLSWSTVSQGTTISPSFYAYRTGSQNAPDATDTKVIFEAELFDTNNNFFTGSSTSYFKPTIAGKYLLSFTVTVTNIADTLYIQPSLYKNGVVYSYGTREVPDASGATRAVLTTIVDANGTTDYFDVRVYNASNLGGSFIYFGSSPTYFTGSRIDGGGLWTDGGATSYLATTDNVGVGTSSAYAQLSVWGNGTGTGKAFEVVNNASTTLLSVSDNGLIGIGTASPTEKLEIDYGNLRMNQEPAPSAPTVAINASAGNLNGAYRYRITFVTADGETGAGTNSASVSPASQQVDLSSIPTGTSKVTARKIYRTLAGGAWPYATQLVATISDNTTTTYTDNIADGSLGVYAPFNNTTGANLYTNSVKSGEASPSVTIFGYNAGKVNTGFQNSFLGMQAGFNNTTGYYNSFLGASAGYSNTTGKQNAFLGIQTGYNNTTGSYNSFMGANTGYFNTTGANNTAQGMQALYYNASATSTTAVGFQAGYGTSGATASQNNVFLGYQSGFANTIGDNNILLGYQSGDNLTSGGNNIVLGYNIDAPAVDSANTLNIGNLIYGTSIDGTGTTLSSGNIGIGTTTPWGKLSVTNTGTGPSFIIEDSTSPDSSPFIVDASGNVGIGTASPAAKLDSYGSIRASDSSSNYIQMSHDSFNPYMKFSGGNGAIVYNPTSGNVNTPNLFLSNTGGVSIGKLANSEKLDVVGNINISSGSTLKVNGTDYAIDNLSDAQKDGTNQNLILGSSGFSGTFYNEYNTAIGFYALSTPNTDNTLAWYGHGNTAVGYSALTNNTNGFQNTALGRSTLINNTTGYYNSAEGYGALLKNTTGYGNTGQGMNALFSNITGSKNTALGFQTLYYNGSATSTVALGYQAGYGTSGATASQNNTFLGFKSGYANTTGNNNILLGYKSGDNLTTGGSNIVLGYDIDAPSATSANTLNIGNLIYGTGVDGTGTTLSSGNIGIGTTTPWGKLSVTNTGTGPSFIIEDSTSPDSSPFIVDASGNVGIGTASPGRKLHVSTPSQVVAQFDSSAASNSFLDIQDTNTTNFRVGVFGSVGGLALGIGTTPSLSIDSSGDIGIATTSPLAKLDVYGDTILSGQNRYINFDYTTGTGGYGFRDSAGTLQYKNSGGSWAGIGSGGGAFTSSGGLTYLSTITDLVGIGTSTPYSALTVWGNGTGTGKAFEVVNNASTTLLSVSDNGLTTLTNATTSQLTVTGPAYFNSTTRLNNVTYSWPGADGSNAQVLASDGAGGLSWSTVSQGTTISPSFSVHKGGSAQTLVGGGLVKITWPTEEFDTNNNFNNNSFSPSVSGYYYISATLFFQSVSVDKYIAAYIYKDGVAIKNMYDVSNGTNNQGVTVSAIVYSDGNNTFEIYGQKSDTTDRNIYGASDYTYFTGSRIDGGGLWTDGGDTSYLATTDNVGVGTSSAYAQLSVWGNGTGTGKAFEVVNNASTTLLTVLDNGNVGIGTVAPDKPLSINDGTFLLTVDGNEITSNGDFYLTSNSGTGDVIFRTGGFNEQMRIDPSGNVGIGTASPTEKLEIDYGNLRMNQEPAPSAPTVAINASAGNLNGAYRYRITFVTADGETGAGANSASVSPASQQVDLSSIPTGTSKVTARKIYRTVAGGGWPFNAQLVATISDNTTTTYTDNLADGSLGVYAPYNNTTGANFYTNSMKFGEASPSVTIFGYNAGSVNTGLNNSFIGVNAGAANTTGYYNSFMGVNAGYNNTTGYNNSFLGANAGSSNTTGYYNSFIGVSAGSKNTTGYNNSFIGASAGAANTTGNYNSFIGVSAGNKNTTGYNNSFVGRNAGYSNITGFNNTVQGTQALNYNASATSTVAVGYQAGYGTSGATASQNNTFLGYKSGFANTTGNNNILLGYQSGDNLTSGGNNIVLGYNIDAPSATSANTLNIGNLIYGTSIDGTGTTLSSGNVGIGTSTPYAKLSVWGNGTSGASAFEVVDSASTTLLTVLDNGNVGIGTAAPGTPLYVLGPAVTNSYIAVDTTSAGWGSGYRILEAGVSKWYMSNVGASDNWGLLNQSATNIITATQAGLVGIGTTSPLAKLDIYGDTILSGQNRYINFDYTTGTNGYGFRDNAGTLQYKNSGGYWKDIGGGSYSSAQFTFASTTAVKLSGAGYYLDGIGTVKWDSQLTFTFGSTGSNAASSNLTASAWSYLYLDASSISGPGVITAANLVDSATAPVWSDSKKGWYNGSDRVIFAVLTDGSSNILEFFHDGGDLVTYADYIEDLALTDIDTTWTGVTLTVPGFVTKSLTSFTMHTADSAAVSAFWRTNGQTGTVGHSVGATTIASNYTFTNTMPVTTDSAQIIEVKLDVSGLSKLAVRTEGWYFPKGMQGNVSGGADLAEWFKVGNVDLGADGKSKIEDGEILCTDTSDSEKVVRCDESYSGKILGISSTNPGLTIGESYKGDNAVKLALTGRVPVKVNLDGGDIKIGDRITSSTVPGFGMKATSIGRTIGTALEPLNSSSNKNTITVFIDPGWSLDGFFATGGDSGEGGSISGNTATSTQNVSTTSSFVGGIVDAVLGKLEYLGVKISDGIAYFNDLTVKGVASVGNLIVGSSDKPSGITIYDEVTGEPYCLKVRDGEMVSVKGKCVAQKAGDGGQTGGEGKGEKINPEAPVITINGNNPAVIEVGSAYSDLGAVVTDNKDLNLGIYAKVDDGEYGDISNINIDTSTSTTYMIVYKATDNDGNTIFAKRSVIVGENTVENGNGNDGGGSDGGSGSVDGGDVQNNGDTSTTTTSILDTDTSTSTTTQETSVDTILPTITLTGQGTIEVIEGDTYIDEGATASDNIDGDITSDIAISGVVDTSAPGSYTITYNVSDGAGNQADEVSRIVTVLPLPEPVVSEDTATSTSATGTTTPSI